MLPNKAFAKPIKRSSVPTKETTLPQLLESLSFSREGLQKAVLDQAPLFMEAASYRVAKMKNRQDAEAALDEMRRTMSLKIREDNAGKKGLTERFINDFIEDQASVKEARRKLEQSERVEELSKLLIEAYRHRKDSLRILAGFYFGDDPMRVGVADTTARERRKRLAALDDREDDPA